MRYNHFDMLPERAFHKVGGRITYEGGGSGGGSTQSSSTAYNTNIPEYAQPYVTSMLNATQQQLFNVEDGQVTGFAPYVPYSANPSDYVAGFSPLQQQVQETAANLQTPSQFGYGSDLAAAAGEGALGTTGAAMGYGSMGSDYGQQGAQIGQGALGYGAMGAGYGGLGAGTAGTALGYGAGAAGIGGAATMTGANYQRMATDPNSVQAYMNPYVQASLAPQLELMNQQLAQQQQKNQAQAVGQGAYGGSRQAVQQALTQQNADLAKQQMISQGYNTAFQQAQQAQQFGANLGLQGLQTGIQGQQAALQGVQGAQAGYGLGIQGAQAGLAGVQGALAGTAQGMQGAQIGLQGVQGAQAGYGLANQAAGTMGSLGSQQLAAQQGILGLQNQLGGQQQQYQQQIINQAIQDYANAQQYPLMQLGTMSNMLRGLPLQSSTTQQYIAQPNQATQAISTLGTAGSLYKAMGSKKGGMIKEKKMAKGGITSYDVGGSVRSKLYDMNPDQLKGELDSPSQEVRKMARGIMLEKQVQGKAGGGIIAFSGGTPDPEIIPAPEAATDTQYAAPQRAAPAPITDANSLIKYLGAQGQQSLERANAPTGEGAAARRAYIGEDTAGQEYRAKLMSERANAKDEGIRQNWMRAAEFFADWGSRPGNTLAAGMMALKNTIPNVISDQKEQKKYERETDKILYELGKAERAEKAGDWDKAEEAKNKAGEMGWKYLSPLSSIFQNREQIQGNLAAASISANRETDQDKRIADIKAQLVADNPTLKNDPRLGAMAFEKYTMLYGGTGAKLESTNRQKIETLVKDRMAGKEATAERTALTMATASGDAAKIAAAEAKYNAKEAKIRAEVTAGIGDTPAPTVAETPKPASYTKDSVTVGDQTYTRPANFTDAQWSAYKQSVGAK